MTQEKQVSEAVVVSEKRDVEMVQVDTTSVDSLISKAIEKGLDVTTMEKLLTMRREMKAEWAKEQFDLNMASAQAEFPIIEKTSSARDSSGKVLYTYAGIDAIVSQTKEIIGKYGFSYSFKTVNLTDKVTVTCIVKHKFGHTEESVMETALATKTGIMSAPQQTASTVTFNKRYAFCNAFGITTGDEDKEEAVRDAEASQGEIEKAKSLLNKCTTKKAFAETWNSFPAHVKATREVVVYAKEIQDLIKSNENA